MSTQLLYQGEEGSKPTLIGYFKESPKQVLQKLHLNNRIYKYNTVLAPVDSRLENRCSGLVISESDVNTVESIDNYWLPKAWGEYVNEEICFNAIQDAIENYLTVSKIGSPNVSYLELRDWKEDPLREQIVRDLLDIISVTLRVRKPTSKDLNFISECQ